MSDETPSLDDVLAETDKDATLATDVPREVKEILEEQDCYQWEAITEAVFNTFGGERLTSPAALNREIEQERRKVRDAKEDKRDAEDRIQRHSQRIKQLEERREKILEARDSKEDALDALLDELHAQELGCVWEDHPRVERIASRWFGGEHNAAAAFEALLDRHDERGMNLPDSQFEEGGLASSDDYEFAAVEGGSE